MDLFPKKTREGEGGRRTKKVKWREEVEVATKTKTKEQ